MKSFYIAFLSLLTYYGTAQNADPVSIVDEYFKTINKQQSDFASLFHSSANINTVIYDSIGTPGLKQYSLKEYSSAFSKSFQAFFIQQESIVLLVRKYGFSASVFTSVYSKYLSPTDTIELKAIHSFKLIFQNDRWLIDHLNIQQEMPGYEMGKDLWPEALVAQYAAKKNPKIKDKSGPGKEPTAYDASVVFEPFQVDETPVYPLGEAALKQLMESYSIKEGLSETEALVKSFNPFIIIIGEDGMAKLGSTSDLASDQKARAESFVRSLMIWYPALLDGASVQCQLLFFIR